MKRNLIGKAFMAAAFMAFSINFFVTLTAGAETDVPPAGRWAAARLKTVEQDYRAHLRAGALQTGKSQSQSQSTDAGQAGPASAWLTRVSASEVNMVTNRRAETPQAAVSLDNRSYYCPDGAYALDLSRNPSKRFATDPFTDKRVDKAQAVIYADASGRVYYFESEDTYKGFIGLANTEKAPARD